MGNLHNYGYGQHGQHGMHQGLPQGPPGGPVAAPMTAGADPVASVTGMLMQGEWITFYRVTPAVTGIVWFMGIVLLPVVIGMAFIWVALNEHKKQPRGVVMTNRRLFVIHGSGRLEEFYFHHFSDVEARRMQTNTRGQGVLAAVAAAGIAAAMNSSAAGNPKQAPAYWSRADAIRLMLPHGIGAEIVLPHGHIPEIGTRLATSITYRAGDQFPAVDPAQVQHQFSHSEVVRAKGDRNWKIITAVAAVVMVACPLIYFELESIERAEAQRRYEFIRQHDRARGY